MAMVVIATTPNLGRTDQSHSGSFDVTFTVPAKSVYSPSSKLAIEFTGLTDRVAPDKYTGMRANCYNLQCQRYQVSDFHATTGTKKL